MAHYDLTRSPIYQRACATPDVMGRTPGYYYDRKEYRRDDYMAEEAWRRLDHLIKNALRDPDRPIAEHIVCAIKAFLLLLDKTLPMMSNLNPTLRAEIDRRIGFCRQIVSASDQERLTYNCVPLTAEWFELLVQRHRGSMNELLYGNPFRGLYAGTTYHG